MSDDTENSCSTCSTNQHCCSRLGGLVLAEEEFEQHFKRLQHTLAVRRSNRVVTVTPLDGGPCPYWGKGGCTIYEVRPVDCRLFPYIPLHVIERSRSVKIVYHGRSDCPIKDRLFPMMPEQEIHSLLVALGRKMYGESKKIVVRYEKGTFDRLRHRIEAAISRRIYRTRSGL